MFAYLPSQVLPKIDQIVNFLIASGARVYVVGGAVRDVLLQLPVHDIDIEVHALTPEQLEKILSQFGAVHFDGKSFGVFRINGVPIDWALPRRDSSGRKPVVQVDPNMDIASALRRRDLTMNAMAVDLATGELVDPFGGIKDLKNKVLATPDPDFFIQDPLRFYRVMQFIARFGMQPTDELNALCKTMDISAISAERIHAEFDKLVMLSNRPSLGIRWLQQIDRLKEVLPELHVTVGIPQEKDWHPEGDVFEHTMQAMDAATQRPVNDRRLLVFAALCHDLGKVTTTKIKDGRWRSFNHEAAGVEPAERLCKHITGNKKIICLVKFLVKYHMSPGQFVSQQATAKAYKKLASILAPDLNLYFLAQLAYADKLGRNPDRYFPLQGDLPVMDQFMKHAEEYGVLHAPEKPLISGSDLMPLGFSGPALGKVLSDAYAYQIEQQNPTRETILRYVQRNGKLK